MNPRIKPIFAAIATVTACSTAQAGALEDRIQSLEQELQALKAEVAANKGDITSNQASIEEARPTRAGTKFGYGGFIQLDANASSYSDGQPGFYAAEDLLVASTIPVEPDGGDSDSYSSTNIHAKSSRFYFTTETDTAAGKVSSRIEMDFILSGDDNDERISNSWNSRIRHAFLKWDYAEDSSILAGQSWSTFFNVGALPDLLDFVGPVGTLFNRQPQIRWTMGGLQLSVENAVTRLNGVDWDDTHEGIPDIVARYNGQSGDLSWSVAGIVRELTFEERDTSRAVELASDEAFGYGLSLAGKWMLGKDDLRFMVNYGSALGRYLGLNSYNDGYVDAAGDIETIDQWGAVLAYRHFWTPQWRSTFSLSASGADNPDSGDFAGADDLAKAYQSIHANLNYLPAPRLSLGAELIYANKELEDGREGDLNRLQFAVKYAF